MLVEVDFDLQCATTLASEKTFSAALDRPGQRRRFFEAIEATLQARGSRRAEGAGETHQPVGRLDVPTQCAVHVVQRGLG